MKTLSTKSAKSAQETPEAQLGGLVITRDNLQARQAAIAVEVEAALTTRRKALIEGGSASEIAEAERICREVESTAYGIADALAEMGRRIADVERRIEAQQEQARIAAVADGLERNAGEIEAGMALLAKALAEVGRCHTNLAVTMNAATAGQYDPADGVPTPSEVATAIVLQGLAHVMPGVEIHADVRPWSLHSGRQLVEGVDPVAKAAGFAMKIRATATRIRTGEATPDLPEAHEPVPALTADNREMVTHVTRPFFYNRGDLRVMVPPGTQSLPAPVSDLALGHGLAAQEPPPKRDIGSAVFETTALRWEDCRNLNFDLSAWQAEDIEARRDAIRAVQERQAA